VQEPESSSPKGRRKKAVYNKPASAGGSVLPPLLHGLSDSILGSEKLVTPLLASLSFQNTVLKQKNSSLEAQSMLSVRGDHADPALHPQEARNDDSVQVMSSHDKRATSPGAVREPTFKPST
jgi:hypothetical protein